MFLALAAGLGLALALAGGCAEQRAAAPALSAEEEFFVQQYLRVVEARRLAALGDSLAGERFARLAASLPDDSLRALAGAFSAEQPERWPLIFEEIVRRKQALEGEPPR
ncbi:hypothetical protein FJ251_06500 [bacterium]|nr:hypothetical protein [bacterium]